jgi:tetratricopeptide (TPR) repeat protein
MKRILVLISLTLAMTISLSAQTKNDAVEAYNKGVDLMAADPASAIKAFEECIKISLQLGEEGEETMELAELQLPGLYYEVALKLFRERKIAEAVTSFETAVEVAEKYKDSEFKSRSETVLHQLYFTRGNEFFRNNEDDKALEYFNKSLSINPSYARAYLGKGLVFRKQEKTPEFAEAMDMAIESGLQSNDERTVTTASNTARDYFLVRAVRAKDRNDFAESYSLIESALKYDNKSTETYFLLAVISNAQSKWDEAINAINQGLDLLEDASNEDKAKFYFEMGNSYVGKDDIENACKAFKNAAYGLFQESADFQVKHVLECK